MINGLNGGHAKGMREFADVIKGGVIHPGFDQGRQQRYP